MPKINESAISEQPDQWQQSQNLRSWITSIDDYNMLKKMLTNTKKTSTHIALMVKI